MFGRPFLFPDFSLLASALPRTLLRTRFMSTAADWKTVDGPVSYRVFTKPLVKSEQDDRDYRVIQLENGLQATLVHDAKADKAAASLDVAVGHLHDPVSPLSMACITSLNYLRLPTG